MKKSILLLFVFASFVFSGHAQLSVYHPVVRDTSGNILPWYSADHAASYDHVLGLVWNFWKNLPSYNGYKYYMTNHTYSPQSTGNKVGGDQFAMALSSWALYYAYTGDTDLVKDMVYIADNYLDKSLSLPTDSWPNLPYPCNIGDQTLAVYDGDYLLGVGYTQPDKAGSFGAELISLYKITRNVKYLNAAVKIANTLSAKVLPGDSFTSPYPFKVNAVTGALPTVPSAPFHYTGNVIPTMRLFEELSNLKQGNTVQYDTAYNVLKRWVQKAPQKTNNWGSFFEDIPVPSNTETNAVTAAYYILEHPNWSATYIQDARAILDWTTSALGCHLYDTLGVVPLFEQSVDLYEAGSHTSRFASAEMLYAEKTADTSRVTQATRQLDWSTYVVDYDGKCLFSPRRSAIWYTDGYGDYVRHFLRAMAANPNIAPDNANHLLRTSSVVSYIKYEPHEINYSTFDSAAAETLRLTSKPLQVKANGTQVNELGTLNADGWVWQPLATGGLLKVKHSNARAIDILWAGAGITSVSNNNSSLELYPNPASGNVRITYTADAAQAVSIELTDLAGKKVKEFNTLAHADANQENISIAELQAGVYVIHLKGKSVQGVKKLVVE